MNIIEKDLLFTIVTIQLMLIGLLNFGTFKKVDILNRKYIELKSTFYDLRRIRKKL